ncbi:MAG: hypothetical protein WDM77_06160 [Steroidobacteraceae bacterium]
MRFEVDDQTIEATVFPTDGIRQAPVSPVDGKADAACRCRGRGGAARLPLISLCGW